MNLNKQQNHENPVSIDEQTEQSWHQQTSHVIPNNWM